MALLRALGDETAGAFRFVVPGREEGEHRGRERISEEELEEWAEGAPAFSTDSERPPRLSLAGAQHKTSVVQTPEGYAVPAAGEPSTHILKFDSPDFPHLAANEFLTTRFADNLGLDVVDSRLDDQTSPPLLVVERYDRRDEGETVRRLHQEDFCQILGYLPTQKYESDGGPNLGEVAEGLRSHSAQPAADILRLVRWVVFCALAGNADGHAKNLSVLYTGRGLTLAPVYDLVCTRAYPRLHRDLAFAVGGGRNPDRLQKENWRAFAEAIDVKPRLVLRQVERLVDKAAEAFEQAATQLRDQVGDSHAIQHVGKATRKRIRAIRSHL